MKTRDDDRPSSLGKEGHDDLSSQPNNVNHTQKTHFRSSQRFEKKLHHYGLWNAGD